MNCPTSAVAFIVDNQRSVCTSRGQNRCTGSEKDRLLLASLMTLAPTLKLDPGYHDRPPIPRQKARRALASLSELATALLGEYVMFKHAERGHVEVRI